MKCSKGIFLLLAILVAGGLFFGFASPVFAQGVVARVVCPATDPSPGTSITTPIFINMSAVPSPDDRLGSFTGSLRWNAAVVRHTGDSGLKGAFSGGTVNRDSAAFGVLKFSAANATGAAGDVNIIDATFTVIGASGSSTIMNLGFTAMAAAGSFRNLLPILTVNDCTVRVGGGGGPALVVNPASLSFSAQQGGTNPPNQTFNITNGGTGTLNWSNTDNQTWLSVSPTSGTTTTETDPVTVSINIAGLTSGTHTGTITVTAPGATGSPATVQVTLTITQVGGGVVARVVCPATDPSPGTSITTPIFINMSAVPPPDDRLGSFTGSLRWNAAVVRHTGDSGLKGAFSGGTVNRDSAAFGVLKFSAANATGASGDVNIIDATFTVIGASGSSTIMNFGFTAMAAAGSFRNLLPILTVNDCTVRVSGGGVPALVVNPASLSFSAQQGGTNPPNQTFNITNGGTGTLNWSITDNQTWLSVSPTSGTTTTETDPVTVSINIAGLTSGTLTGTITVTAPGATGSPATVQVTLTITQVGGGVVARVVCPATDPSPGTSITTPIFINMSAVPPPDDRLGSFTGSLRWNAAVVRHTGDSGLKGVFSGGTVNRDSAAFGVLKFSAANATGTSGDVNIIDATFIVVGASGSSTIMNLGFTAMAAAGSFRNLLPILTVNDCTVRVGPGTPPCNPASCSGPAIYSTPRGGVLGQRLSGRDKDTLYVDLRMQNNPQPVDAFGFRVNVNPNRLSFVRATRGNLTTSFIQVSANETPAGSGTITCGGFGVTPIPVNSNGVLLTLYFLINCPSTDSSQVTISNLSDDVAGFSACCNVFRCLLCVEDGDVNGDGRLTPGDALCAFQIFLNGGVLPSSCDTPGFTCELVAADVNCDKAVTPGDALSIFNRFIAGLPPLQCFARTSVVQRKSQTAPYQLSLLQRVIRPAPETGNQERLKLTLVIDNPDGLNAFGLQLYYPADKLQFLGIERTALTADWMQLAGQASAAGVVTIGGFDKTALASTAAGELLQVVFSTQGQPLDPTEFVVHYLVDDFSSAVVKVSDSSLKNIAGVPAAFKLYQNFPNPARAGIAGSATLLRFDLPGPEAQSLELAIYNIHGQLVRRLITGKHAPGTYAVAWDGRDEQGRSVASGTYLYRFKAATFFATRRLTIVR